MIGLIFQKTLNVNPEHLNNIESYKVERSTNNSLNVVNDTIGKRVILMKKVNDKFT